MLRYEVVKMWLEDLPVSKSEKRLDETRTEYLEAYSHYKRTNMWVDGAFYGPMPTPSTIVTLEDSALAGNCDSGTRRWTEVHFPGRTKVTVREVMKKKYAFNHSFVKAARVAAARKDPKKAAQNLKRAKEENESALEAVNAAHRAILAASADYDRFEHSPLKSALYRWTIDETLARIGLGDLPGCSSWQIEAGRQVGLARNHRFHPGCLRGLSARKALKEINDYLADWYAGRWWEWDEEHKALSYKSGTGCTKVYITPEKTTVSWDEGPLHMRARLDAGGDPRLLGRAVELRFNARKLKSTTHNFHVSCWDDGEEALEDLAQFGGIVPIKFNRTLRNASRRAASAALACR